jgi:RNA polymerase sigma-70 factor (ECF subfamily)
LGEMSNRVDDRNRPQADADEEIVSLCQKGNLNAFETLVERHQKKMFNVAYRMTGDYDEASEIVQDAFLSAYRGIKTFRGEARFSTWLTGIVINHAKNRLKQIATRFRYEGQTVDDPLETEEGRIIGEPRSGEMPIVEQLERKEVQEKVQECINTLEEEYREVIVLRDIQGFSYEEIRDILNIPDGTVKSRLFRARDALRGSLKKVFGKL